MIKQRDIHSNFKAKYINHCCILKGDYVVNLLNQIRSKLNVQSNLTGAQAGAIDTTGFLNNATSYYNGFTGGFTNGVMPGMDISYMNQYNAGRFY
jgi:hypothetical protein